MRIENQINRMIKMSNEIKDMINDIKMLNILTESIIDSIKLQQPIQKGNNFDTYA